MYNFLKKIGVIPRVFFVISALVLLITSIGACVKEDNFLETENTDFLDNLSFVDEQQPSNEIVTPVKYAWKKMPDVVLDGEAWGGGFSLSTTSFNGKLYMAEKDKFGSFMSTTDGQTWQKELDISNLSHEGESSELVVFNDSFWFVGGIRGNSISQVPASSVDGTWGEINIFGEKLPSLKKHSVVVFNNKIFAIGGISNGVTTNEVWSSSDGSTWSKGVVDSPWSARYEHEVVEFNEKLILTGGRDSSGSLYDDIWTSSDGETWTEVENGASPRWGGRWTHKTVVFQDKIWMIGGGYDVTITPLREVWTSTDVVNWEDVTPAEDEDSFQERMYVGAVVHDDRLYVIGGFGRGGLYNDVYCYCPED